MLERINTFDKLQVCRPHKALSPNACIMYLKDVESISHLFLHCEVVIALRWKLFEVKGWSWVCPNSPVQHMQMKFVGHGGGNQQKTL